MKKQLFALTLILVCGCQLTALSAMQPLMAGDGDTIVNTGIVPDPNCLVGTYTYTENFDDATHYGCLRYVDANNDGSTWGIDATHGCDSSHCALVSYAMNADDYLVLPGIVLAGNYTIEWKAKAFSATYPESYQVLAGDSVIFDEELSSIAFVTRSASFTVAEGDTVLPMFRYISDDMYYLYLDNITIVCTNPPVPPAQYTVTVLSNDNTLGSVSGGGVYTDGDTATIVAAPAANCIFLHWQDGDTNLTRRFAVTADTTFTATFEALPPVQYTVTVNRICTNCGNDEVPEDFVSGEGVYDEGDTVTLEGTVQGCALSFDFWITETGDTIYDNPYSFVIDSDRHFMAVFTLYGGIASAGEFQPQVVLSPNPVSDQVTIITSDLQLLSSDIRILDVTGRTVYTQTTGQSDGSAVTLNVGNLPQGLYFLKLGAHSSPFLIQR